METPLGDSFTSQHGLYHHVMLLVHPSVSPLTPRTKEEEGDSTLPDFLADPDTVVEQPSVSRMIAEQLARGRQEEEEDEEWKIKKSAVKDAKVDERIQSDLERKRNKSFHIRGENIELDDCEENNEEPHDEGDSEVEEEVKEDDPDVTFFKNIKGGELDTTTVITTMLSELASESNSRETSVGR